MYIAQSDINIGQEIQCNPVEKLSDVYDLSEEGLPVYELTKSENGFRVIKQVSEKEIKKAIEKKFKRLDIAIFFNSLADVKKIYALKTPLKRSSDYSLCYACRVGNLNIVKVIMESGEIDMDSYYTKEALEVAVEYNYIDIVKYLLKAGLNPCDHSFYSLIIARKNNYNEIIDVLEKEIKKKLGKLPDIKDPYDIMMENRAKQEVQVQNIEVLPEVEENKSSGRGIVQAKLPKKEKPKKEIKSLEELKAKSALLLKDKTSKTVKKDKPKKENKKPKKEIKSLEELKARSQKLLTKDKSSVKKKK